ncbi:ComF family protein [Candidatus Saccharibacteria bacterium]|nr:ComF family protein [Candidatus Saccharibacteria bacterium]
MDERKKVRKIFREAEFLGFRDEILGELVEEYKYSAIRGMSREIAEIVFLDFVVPFLEKDPEATETILCPMPTSRKHIRERGFDHIYIVAKRIEKMAGRKIEVRKLLLRAKDTTQVGASEEMRQKQAKEAVRLNPVFLGEDGKILEEIREKKVILFDDVWTTGASMREAGEKLRRAGVKNLYGLTVTKNRYQKSPLIRGGELF